MQLFSVFKFLRCEIAKRRFHFLFNFWLLFIYVLLRNIKLGANNLNQRITKLYCRSKYWTGYINSNFSWSIFKSCNKSLITWVAWPYRQHAALALVFYSPIHQELRVDTSDCSILYMYRFEEFSNSPRWASILSNYVLDFALLFW